MRVLALDYGTARCGCAISDPTGTLARPLPALEPPDPGAVARLVADNDAERVVVGLPLSLGGEDSAQTTLSREFAAELGELLDVPVDTYDERLTTTMADRSAREGASADHDSLAAAHLLESYLESIARQGVPGDARGPRARSGGATRDREKETPSDE